MSSFQPGEITYLVCQQVTTLLCTTVPASGARGISYQHLCQGIGDRAIDLARDAPAESKLQCFVYLNLVPITDLMFHLSCVHQELRAIREERRRDRRLLGIVLEHLAARTLLNLLSRTRLDLTFETLRRCKRCPHLIQTPARPMTVLDRGLNRTTHMSHHVLGIQI